MLQALDAAGAEERVFWFYPLTVVSLIAVYLEEQSRQKQNKTKTRIEFFSNISS